ncbi:TetR/AcrR family transcriptional regulator [Virgibacillus soli]
MEKRQLIMDKSMELFAEQGFRNTSVQQITDYCGISKGAFYLSFKTKNELIMALIDSLMEKMTLEADRAVKTASDKDLLYAFYYQIFHSFRKHSVFGKLIVSEHMQSINEELVSKIYYYQNLLDKLILTIIERLYGNKIEKTKYDLMYCVKSFLGMYTELFISNNELPDVELDLDLLARSLVEKTNILAKHAFTPFVSHELFQIYKNPTIGDMTQQQIITLMEENMEKMEDSIEKDSLILLKQHLIEPKFSPAIVKGLIENIRHHPNCKLIVYLLENRGDFY